MHALVLLIFPNQFRVSMCAYLKLSFNIFFSFQKHPLPFAPLLKFFIHLCLFLCLFRFLQLLLCQVSFPPGFISENCSSSLSQSLIWYLGRRQLYEAAFKLFYKHEVLNFQRLPLYNLHYTILTWFSCDKIANLEFQAFSLGKSQSIITYNILLHQISIIFADLYVL